MRSILTLATFAALALAGPALAADSTFNPPSVNYRLPNALHAQDAEHANKADWAKVAESADSAGVVEFAKSAGTAEYAKRAGSSGSVSDRCPSGEHLSWSGCVPDGS